MAAALGYSWLIEQYGLPTLPLDACARLDTRIRGRQKTQAGQQLVDLFEPSYQPEETLAAQLQFALRYEGVNLQVLALLFNAKAFTGTGEAELCQWLAGSPSSSYARQACFLYEWLTDKPLPMEDPVSPKTRYVPVVDPELQFCRAEGERVSRFRVLNNLPGKRDFCPMVRNTDALRALVQKNLHQRTAEVLAAYDPDLLRRAAAFLYMKETQSSFEVEREKPSPQRAQRFADLLRQADTREPLSEQRLVELQHGVLDARFHEFGWRQQQNWIGKDLGFRQQVDFVPPRPADVPGLMNGLLQMAADLHEGMDAVVAATAIAFGFVYIHPFMDGNGRIHRYLIHDVLAKAGFTPRGMVLPVSAVILANLPAYIDTLEHFSRPLNQRTDFNPDTPDLPASGNDAVYYRYPDFTVQAEFLYQALERTVEEDLQHEIHFLLGFDTAYKSLNAMLDWPPHSLDLFIRVVQQNEGRLSASKRKSHFAWLTDNELEQAEVLVQQAFADKNIGKA